MDNYKFRVEFLEEAKEFLDKLDKKQELRQFTIFEKQEVQTIKSFSKNFKRKFGTLGQNSTKLITDCSLFGTKPINQIQLLFQLTDQSRKQIKLRKVKLNELKEQDKSILMRKIKRNENIYFRKID